MAIKFSMGATPSGPDTSMPGGRTKRGPRPQRLTSSGRTKVVIHRNKKGHTGTIAGIGHKARKPAVTTGAPGPAGPGHAAFPTPLPARKTFGPTKRTTGAARGLFNRFRGK
jgi:hypothetical protein